MKIELEDKLRRGDRVERITTAVLSTITICIFGRYLWGHLPEVWGILTNQWTIGIFIVEGFAGLVMLFVKK